MNIARTLPKGLFIYCLLIAFVQCPGSRRTSYDDQDAEVYDAEANLYQGQKSVEKIKKALSEVDHQLSKGLIWQQSSGKDKQVLIYFMGLTGVGKSTLINYLLNNELQYQRQGRRYTITKKSEKMYSPKIGITRIAETRIPQAYHDPQQNILYVDTPGFMNNKGLIEEIADSYANSRVFISGKNIKIVLVLDYETLEAGRGQFLIKSAKKIRQLFPKQFQQIVNSIAIIITKVKPQETSLKDLIKTVKQIKQDSQDYQQDQCISILLQTIIRNKRIYLLPMPDDAQIQQYKKQIKDELTMNSRNAIQPHKLKKDAKLDLSAESRIMVEKLGQSIQKYIRNSHQKIQSLISQKFEKYLKIDDRDIEKIKSSQVRSVIQQLGQFSKMVGSSKKLSIEQTKKFLTFVGITDQYDQQELLKNIDYLKYCNSLHQYVNVGDFFYDIADSLLSVIGELKITLEKIQNYETLQKVQQNHQQGIEKVKKEVNEKYDKKIEAAKKQYDGKVKELKKQMTAQSEQKIKQLTKNHENTIKTLREGLYSEQQKQKKLLQQQFQKRYAKMKGQIEENSAKQIESLKQQLERVRNQQAQVTYNGGGEVDGGNGILDTIVNGVFSVLPLFFL